MIDWYKEEHKDNEGNIYLVSWVCGNKEINASITYTNEHEGHKITSSFFGIDLVFHNLSEEEIKMTAEIIIKERALSITKSLHDFL